MYTYCIFLHVVCGWKECCHLLWTEKLLHKKSVFKYWRKCFFKILFLSQSRWLLQLNQFVDYSVSCDQQHPRLDKSQNFMTLISSALQGFFLPKVQEMQSNIHKVLLCGKRHAEAVVWLVHELVTSFAILFAT